MRRPILISGLAVTVACFVLSAVPAFSADSGTVNAKVTVASPCLQISFAGGLTSIDYGTRPFSTSTSVSSSGWDAGTVDNCAGSAENFSVKGTDATATDANWTLVDPLPCSAGVNKYTVTVDKSPLASGSVALSITNQLLVNVGAGQSVALHPYIYMPCSGSDGAGKTMNFQIVYTASL
jgi:hypothetical protein